MKKLLALMLSVMMVICMMPGMVFASNTENVQAEAKNAWSNVTITLDKASYEYTGQQIQPKIVAVMKDNQNIEKFNVTYDDNKNCVSSSTEEGTVTVTDPTNSSNTKSIKFDIVEKDIKDLEQISEGTITLNSNPIDYIKLKHGTTEITKTGNFNYKDNITPTMQIGYVSFMIEGTGNYKGEKEVTVQVGESLNDFTAALAYPTEKFEYRGKAHTPKIKVSKGNVILTEGKDYYVTYSNNTNAGTANYVVTGQGGYAGTLSGNFTIDAKPLTNSYIYVEPIDNQAVGGTPAVKMYDRAISSTAPLIEDTDYTVLYTGIDTVGTAKVTIIGRGNYTGSLVREFQVKDSILGSYVTYIIKNYDYTGYAVEPLISVKSATKTYILNRDYKIVYEDSNVNAGLCRFKLVGMGNYGGTFFNDSFTIDRKNISSYNTTVSVPDSVLYNGKPVEPAVSVSCDGRTLVKDVDYSVSYLSNNKIGTATVFIYGKGNYTGSVSKTFKIVGKDISSASVTLSSYHYNYTGLECKPSVTVYDGYKRLYSGTDYTVEYKNNRNAGTASVVITGKGNYSGTKTINFTINGKDQTVTTNYTYYTKYLTSDSFNLGAKHDGDGILTYTSSNPEVASVSAFGTVTVKGTGIAYITVATKNTVKYNPAEKVVKITVKPKKPVIKVTSPAKKQIKVQITKVAGATKYQVRYGRTGNYYNKYVTHVNDWNDTVSTTIGNRTSGKNYFVKVRAYKTMSNGEKAWGNWTTVRKVKAK